MAFAETVVQRHIYEGSVPFDITLAEAVRAGDPLGISSGTWVLSAHATGEQPIAIAGASGVIGETITAYMAAVVEFIHTLANAPTVGDKIAVADGGSYAAADSGLPDVGFTISVASDSLSSIGYLCPCAPQLTVVRA